MSPYLHITRQQQLDLALIQLGGTKRMAVDTESSGYYTYFPELCLIQISSGEYHYIIDVLCDLNLDGLAAIFANEKIEKIFHGAGSDIGEMRRQYNWDFSNVFDTLLACRMLGHRSCSLAYLVQEYLKIELKKKEQKSNWKKRPLTRSQLNYAHLDTAYLEEIRERMIAEIKDPALLEELKNECREEVLRSSGRPRAPDGDQWMRVPRAASLSPDKRGYLKELYEIREERARKDNIAPFRLISNEGLRHIASRMPVDLNMLRGMNEINQSFIKKDGLRIVEAYRTATPIQDDDLPKREEQDPTMRSLLRELKKWRRKTAEYRGMDDSLILNNRILEKLAEEMPDSLAALERLKVLSPWKFKMYGEQLLQVLACTYKGEVPQQLPRVTASRRKKWKE